MTNLPVTGIFNVTCEYGRKGNSWIAGYHTGIDITCNNDDIYSACEGEVVRIGFDNSYGNFIVIKNITDNTYQWYCHLKSIKVYKGTKVTRATKIGVMGATGKVTGKHLHFEIRKSSNSYRDNIDPTYWLGIENKVQSGLNSVNYQINNDKQEIKVGDVKKFAVRTNVREEPSLDGKAHLFLANTTIEILQTNVANADGYIWDKVKVVYAGKNDIKEGYVARTCTRYQ